ncbi:MAG: hypothetical protein ABR507_10400 [Actinomycetota bacterium]|nr:hypothetical protein [Actinomycetota bacterium]
MAATDRAAEPLGGPHGYISARAGNASAGKASAEAFPSLGKADAGGPRLGKADAGGPSPTVSESPFVPKVPNNAKPPGVRNPIVGFLAVASIVVVAVAGVFIYWVIRKGL